MNLRVFLVVVMVFAAVMLVSAGVMGLIHPAQAQTTTDYDTDDDGLIDVGSLAQLDAIRYDLDGDGSPASSTPYSTAFPNASSGMGCPASACTGYELTTNLDFDTNGDGRTDIAGDTYWNGGAGWEPVDGDGSGYQNQYFHATFEGNSHVISGLYIDLSGIVGLFGRVWGGEIRDLGLEDVVVRGGTEVGDRTGGLVGSIRGGSSNDSLISASYVTGSVSGGSFVGGLVGINNASISASYAAVAVVGNVNVGGLVGRNSGNSSIISASYATGSVTGGAGFGGGLVGNNGGTITASYATGAVSGSFVSGLVGDNNGTITASYATGAVSGTGTLVGGLVGENDGATVTISYWDTETTGQSSSAGGEGKTTSELRSPTGYTGIYADWNVDVDGDGTGDDPWDFGTSSDYPVIDYDPSAVATPTPTATTTPTTTTDYDADDDGLIEVGSLAQLDAIRYDLDGDGSPTNATAYDAAFPDAATGMGCPQAGCTGYELTADLDFDTNGDGRTDIAGDTYWNGGAGWQPIGGEISAFGATFEGNDNTIANLYINRNLSGMGLFGYTSAQSDIKRIGLVGVNVTGRSNSGGLVGWNRGAITDSYVSGGESSITGAHSVGGLAGGNVGTITDSHATSDVNGEGGVGGLVGRNGGPISSSYATGDVTGIGSGQVWRVGGLVGGWDGPDVDQPISASFATGDVTGYGDVGGLIGGMRQPIANSYATGDVTGNSNVGGLVGGTSALSTTITYSYSIGSVTGNSETGGLVGDNFASGLQTAASYWDTQTSGTSTSDGGEGKTTSELQSPTSNTGIYATWDSNVWDFGTSSQYPALKGLPMSVAEQRQSHPAAVSPPGAPTIGAITPATGTLTISWTAPSTDGGSAITEYNLRHIKTSADESVDSNWTVVDDVWSTGGGTLQYTLTGLTGGTQYDLQVRAVNAGGDGPWSATATGTPTSQASATDAQSGRIAFMSDRDGNFEIYVMNADASDATRLTNNSARDSVPAWSPDGERIAFDSRRDANDGTREIYVMNADGSGVTRLTNNSADDGYSAWSPDGNRIAFVSDRDGDWEIYVMNADGSGVTRLTNNSAFDLEPAWSPDGNRIALRSQRDGNYEIYVMNADGSGATRLTNNSARESDPAWSPDGERIAFASERDGDWEIYVMNADGSGVTRLTNNSAGDHYPAWSPDGERIAFTSERDGYSEIYVMNADGSGVTRLTNNSARDYAPAWSPAAGLSDREILELFYNATDGANWTNNTNWLSDMSIGDWFGVTTDADGHVIRLTLESNNLTGPIPAELGSLSNLARLWLGGNHLTGSIPTELSNLSNLTWLSLSSNQLTGAVPTELSNLSNLTRLGLGYNRLTGAIPAELSNLSNLTHLYFNENDLTGTIPTKIGDLSNLTWLILDGNRLTGAIPSELGSLSNLERLDLGGRQVGVGNQLTGAIPSELGNLSSLTRLSIWGNQLTGAIPSELGSLSNLERLDLSRNALTGTIPTKLGSLSNLTWLSLDENQLTGAIPAELGNLSNLELLDLEDNELTGAVPSELGKLSNLRTLRLSSNQLTGAIPQSFTNLTVLERFRFGNNAGLCAPTDAAFQNWLQGITTSSGPNCSAPPGAPAIGTVTSATGTLAISWTAPSSDGGSAITAYDLRHIETSADETADSNWTMEDDVWTTGGGALQYTLTGLTGGTQYDLQVRAVNAGGDGPWSATATGTPAMAVASPGAPTVSATTTGTALVRLHTAVSVTATFSEPVSGFVAGDVTVVNGDVSNFSGSDGDSVYTFDVTPNAVRVVTVDIAAGVALDSEGDGNTAATQLTLGIPYDDDHDGAINRGEVITAIGDFLFGGLLTRDQIVQIIALFLFG